MIKLILFILLLTSAVFGQSRQELYKKETLEINLALQNKDFKTAIFHFNLADSLRPNTYSILYNLAACYALDNNSAKSISTLRKILQLNTSTQFDADSDFISIKSSPEYKKILTEADALTKPINKCETAIEFQDNSFHPEGTAFDERSKKWILGSIRQRRIVTVDSNGKTDSSFFEKSDNLFSVLGMKTDQKNRKLWVASSAMEYMIDFSPELKGKASIVRYNLDTGKIEKIYSIEGNHVFGDLIVAKNGTVYISDSGSPFLFCIDPKSNQLTEFMNLEFGWNLQGLTFNEDESKIYIADYISGIYLIDLKSKKVSEVNYSKSTSLRGIDGLYWYNNSLLALQNGVAPFRVSRFFLDKKGTSILKDEVVMRNVPELNEPTLGFISKSKFYFISNSPWSAYDRQLNFKPELSQKPLIMTYKLK